jgi:CPA2 family monovalent cation:H+ antiporter-2
MSALELTLFYLFAAVLGVVVFRALKLPPVLGYLFVGVVIGPHALALAQNTQVVHLLSDFGVMFLMFVVGLEFSLAKLKTLRKFVLNLGSLQVFTSTAIFGVMLGAVCYLWPSIWELQWQVVLVVSAALAMSSTAIVIKMLSERQELDTPHGLRIVGILIFQDLAVIPLLIMVPALSSGANDLGIALLSACLKALVLLALLLKLGPHMMRHWLQLVARRKSDELFMLNILLMTLGLAWITELAGLSMALGAFTAGILIAETPFKHRVETDIRPFHDVLVGVFFISIGMMLDWRLVLENLSLVLVFLFCLVMIKVLTTHLLAKLLGAPPGTALRTGLFLAQAGEFGFLLLSLAQGQQLIPDDLLNPLLASMVVSLFITPLLINFSHEVVMKVISSDWLHQSLDLTALARKSIDVNQHVLICGFGRCGQNLARVLEREQIAYLALDLDPDRVRLASSAGHNVVYGDASRLQALIAAGAVRAKAVVITYLDVAGSLKLLALLKAHAPRVPVIVRTQDDLALENLRKAGATEVVPEATEGSLMLASHALALVGVPIKRVFRIVQEQRNNRYQLLRGYFHGMDDDTFDEIEQERLLPITLSASSHAIGRSWKTLKHGLKSIQMVQWRRQGGLLVEDSEAFFLSGDVVVLCGTAEQLAVAEHHMHHGTL